MFIIFYQGEQLRGRVKKICESLKATIYPCPENPQERREVAMGVMTRISDLENVLNTTNEQRNRILAQVARNIRVWFIKVKISLPHEEGFEIVWKFNRSAIFIDIYRYQSKKWMSDKLTEITTKGSFKATKIYKATRLWGTKSVPL